MAANTLTVGNVQIVAIHDNEGALPLSMTFPNVPAEAWAPYQQEYPEGFSGAENLRVHFDCYIVRSQGRTILVDTGGGSMATNPGTVGNLIGGVDGRLTSELRSAGVGLEDVDTVFLTHLHPDHVGWNVSPGGSGPAPTFPNARYVFGQADWEAFRSPKDEEIFGFTFWQETLAPLESAGVIEPIPGEQAITTEVTAVPTPGHTPGSMSLAVVSQGQRAFILGDVFHGPAQVTEPDWVFSFDMDAALAVRTRKQMLDRAESEDAVMAICHHTGFGKVVRTGDRRYWQGV